MLSKARVLAIFVLGWPLLASAQVNDCEIFQTTESTLIAPENSIRKVLNFLVVAQNEQGIKECWNQLRPQSERICETVDNKQKVEVEVRILNAEPNWDRGEGVAIGFCVPSSETAFVNGQIRQLQRAKFNPLKLEKALE